MLQIQQGTVL